MTPEQINIAIAESLGWTDIALGLDRQNDKTVEVFIGHPPLEEDISLLLAVPAYHTSRDACAEFEATLTDDEKRIYLTCLESVVYPDGYFDDFMLVTATAPQRCAAYMKLKGLWKEGAEEAERDGLPELAKRWRESAGDEPAGYRDKFTDILASITDTLNHCKSMGHDAVSIMLEHDLRSLRDMLGRGEDEVATINT